MLKILGDKGSMSTMVDEVGEIFWEDGEIEMVSDSERFASALIRTTRIVWNFEKNCITRFSYVLEIEKSKIFTSLYTHCYEKCRDCHISCWVGSLHDDGHFFLFRTSVISRFYTFVSVVLSAWIIDEDAQVLDNTANSFYFYGLWVFNGRVLLMVKFKTSR